MQSTYILPYVPLPISKTNTLYIPQGIFMNMGASYSLMSFLCWFQNDDHGICGLWRGIEFMMIPSGIRVLWKYR
jgi:hypothetical protein